MTTLELQNPKESASAMSPHNLIVPIMHNAVERVMAAMLGIEIGAAEAFIERGVPESRDEVVAFIGIAGTWAGTGSMSCSAELACRFCELMLTMEAPAVNEEVLDAVGELANMIVGNVKTELERHLGQLCLSSPTAIIGRSFKTKGARNTQWSVLRYDVDGEPLTLKLCLAPRETKCLAADRSPS
jgi:chemotaxis protein CheX